MSKRKYNWNSYESDRFHSEGPSCDAQYDYNNKYPNYNKNEYHNTSANNTQDVVKKIDLHKNPEIFRDNQQKTREFQNESKYKNNWTDRYWIKQNDIPTSTQRSQSGQLNFKKPQNDIEKTLNEMFANPVEISKGKSLLEKMGWKGGGLGKDGDGIVDPIAPKATYATQTIGLGLLTENENDQNQNDREKNKEKNKMKKIKRKSRDEREEFKQLELQFKGYFRTNVLLNILEFVKNNSKSELLFEEKLSRMERKIIHHLVENIQNCDDPELLDFAKESDKEIVGQIMLYNNYILNTESDGKAAKRRLRIYKDAPENVYLIFPDDLRGDDEENQTDIKHESGKDNCNKVTATSNERECTKDEKNWDIDDVQTKPVDNSENDSTKPDDNSENDSSDVRKSENGEVDLKLNIVSNLDINNETDIDTNNKQEDRRDVEEKEERREEGNENSKIKDKECKEKESCLKKIIDYFKEFVDDSIYKEFRFLGDFNNDEIDEIKLFFDICQKKPVEYEGKSDLVKILSHESYTFNTEEDPNGSLLIKKLQNHELPK